jgi:hypothetical protein
MGDDGTSLADEEYCTATEVSEIGRYILYFS